MVSPKALMAPFAMLARNLPLSSGVLRDTVFECHEFLVANTFVHVADVFHYTIAIRSTLNLDEFRLLLRYEKDHTEVEHLAIADAKFDIGFVGFLAMFSISGRHNIDCLMADWGGFGELGFFGRYASLQLVYNL